MLGNLILIIMVISLISAISDGNIQALSQSAMSSCQKAIELTLTLAGTMALWGGLMRIAEKSGITKFIGKIISPITNLLFKDISDNPTARSSITMNITSNLLGLGNAATPLGITAAKALHNNSPYSTRNIAMLTVLNTASIQLIPSTIAAMRLSHGALSPYDIILPVLAVSITSATAGCLFVYAAFSGKKS